MFALASFYYLFVFNLTQVVPNKKSKVCKSCCWLKNYYGSLYCFRKWVFRELLLLLWLKKIEWSCMANSFDHYVTNLLDSFSISLFGYLLQDIMLVFSLILTFDFYRFGRLFIADLMNSLYVNCSRLFMKGLYVSVFLHLFDYFLQSRIITFFKRFYRLLWDFLSDFSC